MSSGSQDQTGGNRLGKEDSPYLLQHAGNPVEWWPWCPEAFEVARKRNVPIFLSIGYATCHWCHVMEHESFENAECAAQMNKSFVCIKVDREQRPDVDDIYMQACQIYTQATEGRASGGWPLSAFLEPSNGMPFFVGTYYPPQPAWGRPSFQQLLDSISNSWSTREAAMIEQSKRIADAVTSAIATEHPPGKISATIAARAALQLLQIEDREHGGFGSAPKFPQPAYFSLLLAAGGEQGGQVVRSSLTKMACGGVFDQVAGGFHRYSVDEAWMIPHFEKMLYDNALLAPLYAQVAAENHDPFLRQICERTLQFVNRELAIPRGGFYCALDADVNGKEGTGHAWSPDRVRTVLESSGILAEDQALLLSVTGMDGAANFRDPHHPNDPPTWVLQMRDPGDALNEKVQRALETLHKNRMTWPQPLRDDKVLLGWNGLMIEGFADSGRWLENDAWKARAEEAANWIFDNLQTTDGWMRCWRSGRASIPATLEDIAGIANACMSIWRNSKEPKWLARAGDLYSSARETFFESEHGRWSDVRAGDSMLFVRPRSCNDGAVPSGTSSILRVMTSLIQAGEDHLLRSDLSISLQAIATTLAEQPLSMANTLSLLPVAQQIVPEVFTAGAVAVQPTSIHAKADTIEGLEIRWTNGAVEIIAEADVEVLAHDGSPRGLRVRVHAPIEIEIETKYPTPIVTHDGAKYLTGLFRIPVRQRKIAAPSAVKLLVTVSVCRKGVCAAPQFVELSVELQTEFSKGD